MIEAEYEGYIDARLGLEPRKPNSKLYMLGWDYGNERNTYTFELDSDKREWMYDGTGNKVYRNQYTKLYEEEV